MNARAGVGPLYVGSPKLTVTVGAGVIFGFALLPALSLERWFGSFAATMAQFTVCSALASIPICGFGAWIAGQHRRWGTQVIAYLSGRSLREVFRSPIVTTIALASSAYLIVFASMTVTTVVRGGPPEIAEIHLSLVLITVLSSTVAWSAIGILLGRTLPRAVALPMAVVLPYATFFTSEFFRGVPGIHLLSTGESAAWAYFQPDITAVIVKALFWMAAAAALSALALARVRMAGRLAWALSVMLTVGILAGDRLGEVPGATSIACYKRVTEVCSDRAHRSVLPSYAELVDEQVASMPEHLRPARVVSAVEFASSGADVVAAPWRGAFSPSSLIDRVPTQVALVDAVYGRCTQQPRTTADGSEISDLLMIWGRLRAGFSPGVQYYLGGPSFSSEGHGKDVMAAATRLSQRPYADQAAWLIANAKAIDSCELGNVTLP